VSLDQATERSIPVSSLNPGSSRQSDALPRRWPVPPSAVYRCTDAHTQSRRQSRHNHTLCT